jgi:hypothetical protein
MAENEILDFGHPNRWRRSRQLLDDPQTTVFTFTQTAGEEFTEVLRNLAVALRKGPLFVLLSAAKQSPVALQSVIAEFKEKRLASLVLGAWQTAKNSSIGAVALSASTSLIQVVVDQIVARSLEKSRFTSPQEQNQLRASLSMEFEQHQPKIHAMLEASMSGKQVQRFRRQTSRPTAHQVAMTSLVAAPSETHRAYR